MENELWKQLEGYKGLYEISSFGRVKSLKRSIPDGRTNAFRTRKEIILSEKQTGRYKKVILTKNGIRICYSIHYLVAKAFLGDRKNGFVVNHKDLNKQNNKVDNLEWVTSKENYSHAKELGVIKSFWLGKNRSEETKKKISLSKKGRVGNRKGVKLSDEIKKKISESLKRKLDIKNNNILITKR